MRMTKFDFSKQNCLFVLITTGLVIGSKLLFFVDWLTELFLDILVRNNNYQINNINNINIYNMIW